MELFRPYLVMLGIAIVFFFVCWMVFREKKSVSRDKRRHVSKRGRRQLMPNDYDKALYGLETTVKNDHLEEVREEVPVEPLAEYTEENTVQLDPKVLQEALPVSEKEDMDATRVIPPIDIEATKVMSAVELEKKLAEPVPTTPSWGNHNEELSTQADIPGVAHFLTFYGTVSGHTKDLVVDITREAYDRLEMDDDEKILELLENIVVSEALLCMQKAYVATPTSWMKETALEAFLDVVHQPKGSTPYLVAFDALHILPHLTLGQFQAMSIILLLRYSRNSNNFTKENLKHYVTKYIEPFLSHISLDDSAYRQLDYLRCTTVEQQKSSFTDVLGEVYPFVFRYRGFTLDELDNALNGQPLDDELVVKSLNSPLYKLAFVDEAMAPRWFRLANINDVDTQRRLMDLMKSKPVAFSGPTSWELLDSLAPRLADLGRIYDKTPLSTVSLTLLGLYLGRAHVKITINEEFDLSRWF